MTYAIRERLDTGAITSLVTEALLDGPVARWMQPHPAVRRRDCPNYFHIFVDHAVHTGEVDTTAEGDTGRLTGVALWFPFTAAVPPPADYERRLKSVAGDTFDRARHLDTALEAEHPVVPHHYLAFLAVRPGMQGRGIGSALLDRHHERLDAAGLPAYLEATDLRNRDLYLRHGYRVRSVIELPDGPPLWTMWRAPMV